MIFELTTFFAAWIFLAVAFWLQRKMCRFSGIGFDMTIVYEAWSKKLNWQDMDEDKLADIERKREDHQYKFRKNSVKFWKVSTWFTYNILAFWLCLTAWHFLTYYPDYSTTTMVSAMFLGAGLTYAIICIYRNRENYLKTKDMWKTSP